MTAAPGEVREVDPFDLPDWLGTAAVTWTAECSLRGGAIPGGFSSEAASFPCDLLAVDQAFPQPVVAEPWRQLAHQLWSRGQVLVLELDGRLVLAAPGTTFSADDVLAVIGRFAKAVGVRPEVFAVTLRP
ncbi:MAG: hypothetical protein JWR35_1214 [Marmoricola sp.]|nr:hypothetical protein [Marmoricola sp.]